MVYRVDTSTRRTVVLGTDVGPRVKLFYRKISIIKRDKYFCTDGFRFRENLLKIEDTEIQPTGRAFV